MAPTGTRGRMAMGRSFSAATGGDALGKAGAGTRNRQGRGRTPGTTSGAGIPEKGGIRTSTRITGAANSLRRNESRAGVRFLVTSSIVTDLPPLNPNCRVPT